MHQAQILHIEDEPDFQLLVRSALWGVDEFRVARVASSSGEAAHEISALTAGAEPVCNVALLDFRLSNDEESSHINEIVSRLTATSAVRWIIAVSSASAKEVGVDVDYDLGKANILDLLELLETLEEHSPRWLATFGQPPDEQP